MALAYLRRPAGSTRLRAGAELGGRRELPAAPTSRRCATRCAATCRALCADCQRRTETNPLRVLDCKVPEDQPIIDALPRIADHLCAGCRDHFAEVRRELDLLGHRRTGSAIAWCAASTTTRARPSRSCSGALGAQNSVLGGGRYDGLVQGPRAAPTSPASASRSGMERLVMMLPEAARERPLRRVRGAARRRRALDTALLLQRELRRAGVARADGPRGAQASRRR